MHNFSAKYEYKKNGKKYQTDMFSYLYHYDTAKLNTLLLGADDAVFERFFMRGLEDLHLLETIGSREKKYPFGRIMALGPYSKYFEPAVMDKFTEYLSTRPKDSLQVLEYLLTMHPEPAYDSLLSACIKNLSESDASRILLNLISPFQLIGGARPKEFVDIVADTSVHAEKYFYNYIPVNSNNIPLIKSLASKTEKVIDVGRVLKKNENDTQLDKLLLLPYFQTDVDTTQLLFDKIVMEIDRKRGFYDILIPNKMAERALETFTFIATYKPHTVTEAMRDFFDMQWPEASLGIIVDKALLDLEIKDSPRSGVMKL